MFSQVLSRVGTYVAYPGYSVAYIVGSVYATRVAYAMRIELGVLPWGKKGGQSPVDALMWQNFCKLIPISEGNLSSF